MQRHLLRSSIVLSLLAVGFVGCGSASPTKVSLLPPAEGDDTEPGIGMIAQAECTDTLDSVYVPRTDLPPYTESQRGKVVRCAFDHTLSSVDLTALLAKWGYSTTAFSSSSEISSVAPNLSIYRIAYRTDRLSGAEGLSTALVLVPDNLVPSSPVIVSAHGSVGLADTCAPSRVALDDDSEKTAHALSLGLAAAGWPVIAPDYAGLGTPGGVSGWLLAEDEAHSILDAPAALRQLLSPEALREAVILVGHSQGGHAVLSAQAYGRSYGTDGVLWGVLAMAPPWFTANTWAAAITPVANLSSEDADQTAFTMEYFYTHGMLYDGAASGLASFVAEKRDAVAQLLSTDCDPASKIKQITSTPADLYDPNLIYMLNTCIFTGKLCDLGQSATWRPRLHADRPALDAYGAPVVVWQGGQDTTVTPARAQCGFDTLREDFKAATDATDRLTICADPSATHSSIVLNEMGWVQSWISARLAGGTAPGCGDDHILNTTCDDLPPNRD